MNQFNNIEDNQNFLSLGFFSGESYLKYIFKKTEKIVAALYLVSNLLKDKEPIKWKLRDLSMSLMTSVLIINDEQAFDKDIASRAIFSDVLEILSTVGLAKLGGLLSPMNHDILVSELEKMTSILKDNMIADKEKKGYVLSESFFKDEAKFSPKVVSNSRPIIKDNMIEPSKKNDRQGTILELLKSQSNLTVKDVAKVVTTCSEKTIQRELITLVEKGIVKREGERRWSRYSLK